MSEHSDGMQDLIGSSIDAIKPKFSSIEPDKISVFLSGQSDIGQTVSVSDIGAGGDKAGASSGIVIFTADVGKGPTKFVLRFAPYDNDSRIFKSYNIEAQHHLQRILSENNVPAPRSFWVDPDGAELGLPGFIMEYVEGQVADGSPFTGGVIADASEADRETMLNNIFGALKQVHTVDWQKHGLDKYCCSGTGDTYIERYLNWFLQTAEWANLPQLDRLKKVYQTLVNNQPNYHADDLTLAHGDPGLGNYLFQGTEVVRILDWELAGIVHPAMDVAMQCASNDFFRAAVPVEIASTIPSEADWIAAYERATGIRIVDFDYFRKMVCFPLLAVLLSMNRSMPDELKGAHLSMLDPVWAVAEAC